MKLSGQETKELRLALTNAFPSQASFKRLTRESDLDLNIEEIVFGENLNDLVFEIIEWAESHNKLDILIKAAYEENPNNLKLKAFVEKYNLFYSFLLISEKYWQNIITVLESINNANKGDLIGSVCRSTLNNIQQFKGDVETAFPESVNPNIDKLEKIFLQKRVYNDRKAPAIVEFAERLATKVEQPYSEQLNQWVKDVAEELNIERPTYSTSQSAADDSQEPLQSYLLVVVEPKGENKVLLTAELIPSYLDIPEKINLEDEKPVVDCLFTEVAYNIYRFIERARESLYGKNYNLTIEVFLPFQYLHENIEFQEINIPNKEPKFIGEDNRFVVRSFERYDRTEEYLNKLINRWQMLEDFLKSSPLTDQDIKTKFSSLEKFENSKFKELYQYFELEKILGLKVNCCLPNLEDKRKFFSYAFKAGIPIFLWTRSNNISNIDTEFDKLLSTEALKKYLVDSVYQLRHYIESNKEECLGYHIGFLCDNPNRLPSRFMPTNSY